MGVELKVISKSPNINTRMESELVDIMKYAFEKHEGSDYIAEKCQNSFGGSWIVISQKNGEDSGFEMSFAFKSLKWIKINKRDTHSFSSSSYAYYLFQISE